MIPYRTCLSIAIVVLIVTSSMAAESSLSNAMARAVQGLKSSTAARSIDYVLPWELKLMAIQQRVVERLEASLAVDEVVTGSVTQAR